MKYIAISIIFLLSCAKKVEKEILPIIPIIPKNVGQIYGVVCDNITKEGIPGIIVWVYDKYGYTVKCASTDIYGSYIINDIPFGEYILKINSGEYYGTAQKYAGQFYKDAYDYRLALPIVLNKEKKKQVANFLLKKGGTIFGKIVDEHNNPLVFNCISLYAYKNKNFYIPYFSVTDSFGRYFVTGIEPGEYRFKIIPDGYLSNFVSDTSIAVAFDTIELPITKVLYGGIICGSITPIVEGKIQVIGTDIAFEKKIPPSGEYIIAGLPTDKYLVKFIPDDNIYSYQYYPEKIFIRNCDTVRDINFEIPIAGIISGEVKDNNGMPIEEFTITIYKLNGEKIYQQGIHSPTGKYEINKIPQGKYRVKISSFVPYANKTYGAQFYNSIVEVKSGFNTTGINFVLNIGSCIQGFIYYNKKLITSDSVEFKVIAVNVENNEIYIGENTFTAGYRIHSIVPGKYKICAIAVDNEFPAIWYDGGKNFYDENTKIIELKEGEFLEINFNCDKGVGKIIGKILADSLVYGYIYCYDSAGYVIKSANINNNVYEINNIFYGKYYIRTYIDGVENVWFNKDTTITTEDDKYINPWVDKIHNLATLIEITEENPIATVDLKVK